MTPRAALLPHEVLCPSCDDGKIPIMQRGRDEMLSTGLLETCERCDGTGVILNERRETPRTPLDDQLTRVVNIVTADRDEWRAQTARLVRENSRLRSENLRYRKAIDKAARVIATRAQFQKGATG